jgi:hypothetical protein
MSATLIVIEPVTCLSESALRRRADSEKAVQPHLGCEPERQLRKLIAEAAASTYATCQLVLAAAFLVAALLGIATSFADLSRLLAPDAIKHTVQKALTVSY